MSKALLQRMLKARETGGVVALADDEGKEGRLSITLRRPAVLRHAETVYTSKGTQPLEILGPFVVGWDGFIEHDFYPAGGDEPVPFDHDLAMEWIADRVEVERKLSEVANAMVRDYLEKREALQKN